MKRNMKDIRAWLTEADPLRAEPLISEDDASRMRRVVVSAASVRESPRLFWPRAIAIAALVVLMVAAGTLGGRRTAPLEHDATVGGEAPSAIDERRQLQFATPGGTRIIWTLDPHFKIEGAVP